MPTRTGSFAIGFRRPGGQWQRDIKVLAAWAKDNGFDSIDLGRATAEDAAAIKSAGLRLGSVDVFGSYSAADADERKKAVAGTVEYIRQSAGFGARVFFTVIGADPTKKRSESYAWAVESFTTIAKTAAQVGAKIAIEGWPGGGPHMANLCCNPETYRAFIKDTDPKVVGINFDPSHLIRMGIDHIRFIREFAPYVYHVHGKDTEIITEAVYEYGLYQPSAFANGHGYGEHAWRYTIPGHGQARWTEIFRTLQSAGFNGVVSVELEDENFNGSDPGEKSGLLHSLNFLRSA